MWFRWESGRQGSGYEKVTLFHLFFCDLYLLRYPTGSFIAPHVDEVPRWKHFRLNFILRKAEGGSFVCPDAFLNWKRIKLFRPDVHKHSVGTITKGTRYVLSIGWIFP